MLMESSVFSSNYTLYSYDNTNILILDDDLYLEYALSPEGGFVTSILNPENLKNSTPLQIRSVSLETEFNATLVPWENTHRFAIHFIGLNVVLDPQAKELFSPPVAWLHAQTAS